MKDLIKDCVLGDLQELKYRIMFPADDVVTRAILRKKPRNWAEVMAWMQQPDDVTAELYPQVANGNLIYPYADSVKQPNAAPHEGPLGDQFSRYHLETTVDHALLVTANLVEKIGNCHLAIALGLLHDVGKKYTAATNATGELCFFNHAKLSAYITGLWLYDNKKLIVPRVDIWTLVAVIYYHMLVKTAPNGYRSKIAHDLQWFFADTSGCCQAKVFNTLIMLDMLNEVDTGCTTDMQLVNVLYKIDDARSTVRACDIGYGFRTRQSCGFKIRQRRLM